MSPDPRPPTVHASCVLVGAAGVLLRGPSGSGKSRLALALLDRARLAGSYAALVADDRVLLTGAHGRLIARSPAALAGMIECRRLGILRLPPAPAAVVRLVLDLVPAAAAPRLPAEPDLRTEILGVSLPRLQLVMGEDGCDVVLAAVAQATQLRERTLETCVCTAT